MSQRYNVTSSLIGRVHTHNDLCDGLAQMRCYSSGGTSRLHKLILQSAIIPPEISSGI